MGGGLRVRLGTTRIGFSSVEKDKKEMKQVKSVQVTKDPQVAGLGLQLAYAHWPLINFSKDLQQACSLLLNKCLLKDINDKF